MGDKWKYYDVDDYKSWKRKQGKEYRSPPRENYLAAAIYIRNLFDGKKFNWAAVGSLAMLCLGSRREMSDIHIVYDDRDYKRIKSKLESDDRVRLPKGINSLFPIKILIKTGPQFKDAGCTMAADVEVDLLPPGSHGSPATDVLSKNQVLLRLNGVDGKLISLRGVNLLYLVNVLLHFTKSQDLVWDPLQDIVFLCQHYGKDIVPVRSQLNPKVLYENFFTSPGFAQLPIEAQRTCSMTLLGQELIRSPPPSLAVTPPPRTNTGGAVVPIGGPNARTAIQPRKSAPTLEDGIPSSHAQSGSSLHGGAKATSNPSATTSNPQSHSATEPRAQAVPVYSAGGDSRSRYRLTSASYTSGQFRSPSLSPPLAPHTSPRPSLKDSRGQGSSFLHTPATHHGRHVSNPQGISTYTSAPMTASYGKPAPRKSLPEMKGIHPRGRSETHAHNIPLQASAAVSSIPPIPQAFGSAAHGVPDQSHTRHSSQPPSRGGNGMNLSGFTSSDQVIVSGRGRMFRHDIPAGQVDSSSRPADESSRATALRLVGPEGLYGTSPNRAYTGGAGAQRPGPSAQVFAAELPAHAPSPKLRPDSPQELPKELFRSSQRTASPQHAFIAELPADSAIPLHPLTAPLQPHSKPSELPTRPTHPRMISDPFAGLPPSLMAGGLRRSPNSTPPIRSPEQLPSQPAVPTPNTHTGPAYSPGYRAYSGPVIPPSTQPSPYTAYTAASTPTTFPFPSVSEPLAGHREQSNKSHIVHQQPATQPQTESSNYKRNSNPTVEVDISLSQRMQPKRLTTGYEQFAHGPYTPVDSASAKTEKSEDLYGYYYRHDNEFVSSQGQGSVGQVGQRYEVHDSRGGDVRLDANRESVYSVYDGESDGSEGIEEVEVPLPLQPRRQWTGF